VTANPNAVTVLGARPAQDRQPEAVIAAIEEVLALARGR
jgi:hypothetical protein